MARYRYWATDAEGNHYEAEMDASSSHEVTQSLRQHGLTVSNVEPVSVPRPAFPGQRRLRWEDLRLFSEQLEAIVRSGYPLVPALSAMAADLHKPELRAATLQLRNDLERGLSLDEGIPAAVASFPAVL